VYPRHTCIHNPNGQPPGEDVGKGPATNDTDIAAGQQPISDLITSLKGSSLEEPKPFYFIDSSSAIADLVDSLTNLPSDPPSLYIDLEGVNLSRQGTVSILQLLVSPHNRTYLIDVHTLGSEAFLTAGANGQTLKMVLESGAVPKAFFDVRNDSDALYSHFGICLAGVQDIQVMEFASRRVRGRFVSGLSKCIEKDLMMTFTEKHTWLAAKEKGLKLFTPERGGSYETLNVRPLSKDLSLYCAQDVQFLPRLWSGYSSKLSHGSLARVKVATEERVKESQSKTYNGHGKHKAVGPW
jgi:exonuclease 3'-5' domain-containing protein 1